MSDDQPPQLELQISSSKALVRRMDQQIDLVDRLLAESAAQALVGPHTFTNSLGMKMIWCPAGTFLMGSPANEEGRNENENQVQVHISQGFWMASTPVTQGQWQALMHSNPSGFKSSADLPVEMVSWNDAQAFCEKLNHLDTLAKRCRYALPTEAQWEYACRAGTKTPFSFGCLFNGREANGNGKLPYGTETEGPYLEKTCPVGRYESNGWGLYDMHGNVWEWCADRCDELPGPLQGGTDPKGPMSGINRVTRGGGWFDRGRFCRSALRFRNDPKLRFIINPANR